jgi:oligoendopeptidase F
LNDKRRARLLFAFMVSAFIGDEVKKITEEAGSFEAKATVSVGNEEIAFRQVPTLMMNDDNRDKRKAFYLAMEPVKKKLTEYDKKVLDEDYRLTNELAGMSYVDFCAFEKETDYDALAVQLRKFLVDTDELFTKQMAEQFAKIGVDLDDAHPWDFAYLARAKSFDEYFKKENLLPTAEKFWRGLGFDITKQSNVKLDIEEREKKVPRAFCMPIRVPEEVVLVIKPHGGQDDFQSFLHESGHTEHFANVNPDLPYELKHMGGHAVSESYAFLCEYLLANPNWLKEFVGMPDEAAKSFANFIMQQKLYFFRRYSAKVLYELKLHRNDLRRLDASFETTDGTYESPAKMYVDILSKATKIKYREDNWLRDVDSGLYSADYVRAWLFEAMLRTKLEEKFGKEWYKSKDAGQFLKSLWQWGATGKTLDELAKDIGYSSVDISYVTNDFLDFFNK